MVSTKTKERKTEIIIKTPCWWKEFIESQFYITSVTLHHLTPQHGCWREILRTWIENSFINWLLTVCKNILLHHSSLPTFTKCWSRQDRDFWKRPSNFQRFLTIVLDVWDPCLAWELEGILTYWLITQFVFYVMQQLYRIQIYFSKE